MNFSIEESKENDLIIKAATGNIKTRTIRNLSFLLTLQAVRINNQGASLLGLAKSIYELYRYIKKKGIGNHINSCTYTHSTQKKGNKTIT